MTKAYSIERVTAGDPLALNYLDHLQSKNTYSLGFLPRIALEEAINRNCVLLAFENGDPCGYMIHGKPKQETRILQTVVQDDARRIQHATALVDALTRIISEVKAETITLHCADDLEANKFWLALNFSKIGERLKNKRGDRWQNRYALELPAKAERVIMERQRDDLAGVSKLKSLLVKGDARMGDVDFAAFRSHKHRLDLGG